MTNIYFKILSTFVFIYFLWAKFLLLFTVFDCVDGYIYCSSSIKCSTGISYKILKILATISLFLQSIITKI